MGTKRWPPLLRGLIIGVALSLLMPLSLVVFGGGGRPDPLVLEGRIKANLRQLGKWDVTWLGDGMPDYYSLSLRNGGLFWDVNFDREMSGKIFHVSAAASAHCIADRTSKVQFEFDGSGVRAMTKLDYSADREGRPVFMSEEEKASLRDRAHTLYFAIYEAVHAK